MIYFDHSNLRMFDIDDTLVMHKEHGTTTRVLVTNPYDNVKRQYEVNTNMVKLLKEEYARGNPIVLWSRRGAAWARAVAEALDLIQYVSLIMDKPMVYFDDKPVTDWLQDRVYIGPEDSFK